MQDNLIEALRFCAAGKLPCSKCPFWKVLDPADSQTKIMLTAADELERIYEKEIKQ